MEALDASAASYTKETAMATDAISNMNLPQIVLAIGSLGTAAYGVVDVSKSLGGGISNMGFGDIKHVIVKFVPASGGSAADSGLSLRSVLATLRANWLNGMAMADQKAVAKSLIKLNLTPATAGMMARATGVDAVVLGSIAGKLAAKGEQAESTSLTTEETDVYGRFDLLLSALLDQGYQRGDQRYRNWAKMAAVPVAVVLAFLGAWGIGANLHGADSLKALVAGLLATPLAPVAKDVASAIQAGSKIAQLWKS